MASDVPAVTQTPIGMGTREPFLVDPGTSSQLGGWKAGSGPPVLVLHGGPGLSYDYLDSMIDDIGGGYQVAIYQQRGLPPSSTSSPVDVAQEVDDVRRILDHLGWAKAWIIGHSWGGHLLLHFAVAHPDRMLGGLAVDTLGGVGDGGLGPFEATMRDRASPEAVTRIDELEEAAAESESADHSMREHLTLMWRGYFADPSSAPPMPQIAVNASAYGILMSAVVAELPNLEASLAAISVPMGFLAGAKSPLPVDKSTRLTAAKIQHAWVEVADQAGHFPWHEAPGSVRRAVDRLVDN